MTYKIKHEIRVIQIITFAGVLLMIPAALIPAADIRKIAVYSDIALIILLGALCFIEQTVRTRVTVGKNFVKIKYLIGEKTVKRDEISALSLEHYSRRRRQSRYTHYTEYRLRLLITLTNGKQIKLTDSATTVSDKSAFLQREHEELRDEEVPLYNAYLIMRRYFEM